jgi:hypothetical protein
VGYLIGFLVGRLDRVHLVRDLEGAPVAIHLASGRRRVWPAGGFDARIHNVPVPSPAMVVSALVDSDDDICVQLAVDDPVEAAGVDEVSVASYAEVRRDPGGIQDHVQRVRGKIDRALDVYRECRQALEASTEEREKELRFLLDLAEKEIGGLSRQLTELTAQLQARGQQPTA